MQISVEQAAENYRQQLKTEVLDDLERSYRLLREQYILNNPDNKGDLRFSIKEQELVDICASIAMAKRLIDTEVK